VSAHKYQKPPVQILQNFLYLLSGTVAQSSSNEMQHVVYFSFVNDVIFSHNLANGAESKTVYIRLCSPVGGTGTKFDVCDCLVLLVIGPPTHSVGDQYCFALWRLLSSVVVCNTLRRYN